MSFSHLLRCTTIVGLLAATTCRANEAFFSKDGESVTFVSLFNTDSILRLDLKTKKVEAIALGSAVKGQDIVSLTSGADGELLFLTEKAAWVHDAKGTRKLCGMGSAAYGSGLAAAPAAAANLTDWLFIAGPRSEKGASAENTFHCRKPGEKAFQPVFCRRVNSVWAGTFASDGRFFFAGEGDLWEGGFDPGEAGGAVATLNGVRIAPLAMMNTDAANGGNLWVAQIMPAGKSLYVLLRGHHMGELLRLPINPVPALNEKSGASGTLGEHYAYLARSLASVQSIVTGADDITASAANEVNGQELLFYRTGIGDGRRGLFIWDKATGKAEQVAVEPSL